MEVNISDALGLTSLAQTVTTALMIISSAELMAQTGFTCLAAQCLARQFVSSFSISDLSLGRRF